MNVKAFVINAFVDGPTGGNPAGVVFDADGLSAAQKKRIAAHLGLSETAFVSTSSSADFKLEFYTPTRQIAHCGHATIAAFSYLRQLGRIAGDTSTKETVDGIRKIVFFGERAFMVQSGPGYLECAPHVESVLSSLGLNAADLMDGVAPLVVNTGNSFLMVACRDALRVKNAKPDLAAIESISRELDLVGYYLFSLDATIDGRDAGARMFAPRYGIDEESATGMAAGPLACFLHDRLYWYKTEFLIEQGHLMPRPSPGLIAVTLTVRNGKILSLMAGGQARVMGTLTLNV